MLGRLTDRQVRPDPLFLMRLQPGARWEGDNISPHHPCTFPNHCARWTAASIPSSSSSSLVLSYPHTLMHHHSNNPNLNSPPLNLHVPGQIRRQTPRLLTDCISPSAYPTTSEPSRHSEHALRPLGPLQTPRTIPCSLHPSHRAQNLP